MYRTSETSCGGYLRAASSTWGVLVLIPVGFLLLLQVGYREELSTSTERTLKLRGDQ